MYKYALLLSKTFDLDVYTTDVKNDNSRIADFEKKNNLNIHYFKNFNTWLSSKFNINISFQLIINLIKNINKYDYVHLAEIRGLNPLFVSILLMFNKKTKLIHSPFGMLSSKVSYFSLNYLFRKLYDFFFIKILYRRIDCSLVENQFEKLTCEKIGIKNTCIIPHSLELLEIKESFDFDHKLKKADLNFLTVCRLHKSKGVLNCLKFIKLLNKSVTGFFHLTIIGDDEGAKKSILSFIKKHQLNKFVDVKNGVYGPERYSIYRNADAFILLPNTNLQTSLASIEALSQNCFTILNDNAFIDNIEGSGAGILVGDSEEINYKLLINLIRNKNNMPQEFFNAFFSNIALHNSLIKIFK